jgi:hypothetical protein
VEEIRHALREIVVTMLCTAAVLGIVELREWWLDHRGRQDPADWGRPGPDPAAAAVVAEAREITRQAAERFR